MNSLQTLLWIEWKKSSAKISILLGILGVGSLILISQGLSGARLTTQAILLLFMYLAGIIMVSILSFQVGTDLRSNKFHPLRLSPISPWMHITARIIFQLGIALGYYTILSLLSYFVFEPFFIGHKFRMGLTILALSFYSLFTVILLSTSFTLLISMLNIAFREKQKSSRLAIFLFCIACLSWWSSMAEWSKKTAGSLISPIRLELPESSIKINSLEKLDFNYFYHYEENLNQEIKKEENSEFSIKNDSAPGRQTPMTDETNKTDNNTSGLLLPLNASIPLYIEPILLTVLISVLIIFLITRIWQEVEL
ncbi:MAG: hypothetical protein R3B45_13175 [Bdellovibrionota bacterium]